MNSLLLPLLLASLPLDAPVDSAPEKTFPNLSAAAQPQPPPPPVIDFTAMTVGVGGSVGAVTFGSVFLVHAAGSVLVSVGCALDRAGAAAGRSCPRENSDMAAQSTLLASAMIGSAAVALLSFAYAVIDLDRQWRAYHAGEGVRAR